MFEDQQDLATKILDQLNKQHLSCAQLAANLEELPWKVSIALNRLCWLEKIDYYCDSKMTKIYERLRSN